MASPAYRCDVCRAQYARCVSCAARRAAHIRERRAAKRAAGVCIDCSERAQPGMSRCARHRADNNARSLASHNDAAYSTTEVND